MLIKRRISMILVLCICKQELHKNKYSNQKEIKTMKTTTSIKILATTLILLIVGCVLSTITIKNYNPFDWSFLSAVCCNVCILCCEIEKKKKEDAAGKSADDKMAIR